VRDRFLDQHRYARRDALQRLFDTHLIRSCQHDAVGTALRNHSFRRLVDRDAYLLGDLGRLWRGVDNGREPSRLALLDFLDMPQPDHASSSDGDS